MTTFAALLAHELRNDPGRPFLTFYDERTGERVELSVTTYANWVAKTASLLVDEHDLARGDVLLVDLPTHWLGPVFLGAAWLAGLTVAFPGVDAPPAAVVCGPAGLAGWADRADDLPVLACSLLPMGVRFDEPLPPGVHDVGVEVWSQPDAFTPYDPPGPGDVALLLPSGPLTQAELWSSAAAGRSATSTGGGRLLSTTNPASPPGAVVAAEPLATSGSLVLVTGAADPSRLEAIAETERATHRRGYSLRSRSATRGLSSVRSPCAPAPGERDRRLPRARSLADDIEETTRVAGTSATTTTPSASSCWQAVTYRAREGDIARPAPVWGKGHTSCNCHTRHRGRDRRSE